MSFKTGDVVVCISTEINPDCQPNPPKLERLKKGALYRVANYHPVSLGRAYWGGKPMAGLQLVGVDHTPGHGWQAWRFRKVVAADQRFIDSLRVRKLERVALKTVASTRPAHEEVGRRLLNCLLPAAWHDQPRRRG